jgi:hypothetical protein
VSPRGLPSDRSSNTDRVGDGKAMCQMAEAPVQELQLTASPSSLGGPISSERGATRSGWERTSAPDHLPTTGSTAESHRKSIHVSSAWSKALIWNCLREPPDQDGKHGAIKPHYLTQVLSRRAVNPHHCLRAGRERLGSHSTSSSNVQQCSEIFRPYRAVVRQYHSP